VFVEVAPGTPIFPLQMFQAIASAPPSAYSPKPETSAAATRCCKPRTSDSAPCPINSSLSKQDFDFGAGAHDALQPVSLSVQVVFVIPVVIS